MTHATLGFGSALVSMPLLIPLVRVQTATPLVAFMALTTTLMVLRNTWRSIDLRAIFASAVGIPFGLYILTDAPQALVPGILGMLLTAYGLYSLMRPELPTVTWSGWTYVLGFCAGLLGAAYNTNGPPVGLLGALMRWSPDRFRATIQGYFAVIWSFRLAVARRERFMDAAGFDLVCLRLTPDSRCRFPWQQTESTYPGRALRAAVV